MNVGPSKVYDIYENVIQIYHNKDLKFFGQYFAKINLKTCQTIRQIKKHHLISKLAVSGPNSCFLSIVLLNLDLIIHAC